MGSGRSFRGARALVALLAVMPLLSLLPAAADVPPPARVTSNYETATSRQLHRDCGYSAPLPGNPSQSLWIFCDTLQTDANGDPYPAALPFWPGTFAAVGPSTPGQVPTGLSELPPPGTSPLPLPSNRAPANFLPNPTDLTAPDGVTPCNQAPPGVPQEGYIGLPVTWALGLTRGPAASVTMTHNGAPLTIPDASSLLFVTYVEGCITQVPGSPMDARGKRAGIAAYDPASHTIVARSTVFSVSSPGAGLEWPRGSLIHPTFSGGYMYTYAVNCDSPIPAFAACGEGRVLVARAPLASIATASAYEYQTGSGWTSDPASAESMLPEVEGLGPLYVHVGNYSSLGEGFMLLEQLSAGGHYRLWQSSSPAGPWTEVRTGIVPGCGSGPGAGCYHIWGQPHLSTSSQLLVSSYATPVAGEYGSVQVTSIGALP